MHSLRNFTVSAAVVIDGALQQELGLSLRGHLIQLGGLVLGQNIRGSRLGLALKTDKLCDALPHRLCTSCLDREHQSYRYSDHESQGPQPADGWIIFGDKGITFGAVARLLQMRIGASVHDVKYSRVSPQGKVMLELHR